MYEKNLKLTNGLFFSQKVLLELTNLVLLGTTYSDRSKKCTKNTWKNNTSFFDNLVK